MISAAKGADNDLQIHQADYLAMRFHVTEPGCHRRGSFQLRG